MQIEVIKLLRSIMCLAVLGQRMTQNSMDLALGNLSAWVASTQHPSTLFTVSTQFP